MEIPHHWDHLEAIFYFGGMGLWEFPAIFPAKTNPAGPIVLPSFTSRRNAIRCDVAQVGAWHPAGASTTAATTSGPSVRRSRPAFNWLRCGGPAENLMGRI